MFEFKLIEHPELGTAAGGGRYADLAGKFSKTKIIGVGAAIGFSRIFWALLEGGKIDVSRFARPVTAVILVMGNDNVAYAMRVADEMRAAGISTEGLRAGTDMPPVWCVSRAATYLDTEKKFKNQIEFADKIGAPFSVIIGDTEVGNNTVALKDMTSGSQREIAVEDLVKLLKK